MDVLTGNQKRLQAANLVVYGYTSDLARAANRGTRRMDNLATTNAETIETPDQALQMLKASCHQQDEAFFRLLYSTLGDAAKNDLLTHLAEHGMNSGRIAWTEVEKRQFSQQTGR
jgi:hypothetical protein